MQLTAGLKEGAESLGNLWTEFCRFVMNSLKQIKFINSMVQVMMLSEGMKIKLFASKEAQRGDFSCRTACLCLLAKTKVVSKSEGECNL